MLENGWVGRPLPQAGIEERVRGAVRYVGDLRVAGALHGAVARSPVQHGIIRRIDTTKALRVPGVKAVL